MPLRAQCTICSDFFDHHCDVAAIHCGHTFHYHCLEQWFTSAPSPTCPQCRIQVSKWQIIPKLFFNVGSEEAMALDPESLKNEVDQLKANLYIKDKEKREYQDLGSRLLEKLDDRNVTIQRLQKKLDKLEMMCSSLKRQMKFFEQQQSQTKAAKEEARRLRNKLQQLESEYEKKEVRKSSAKMMESAPTATNEAISRLIFESPAPIGLQRPKLRPPKRRDDLDLCFAINTPEQYTQKTIIAPSFFE